MKKSKKRIIVLLGATLFLFVLSSYLSQTYSDELLQIDSLQGSGWRLVYSALVALAVIVAPFETLPLLPVAATLWGAWQAAWLSIGGWLAGSIIAFVLARRYGERLVCKLVNKCDLDDWKLVIPKKNLFWLIILARFLFPVDIISYLVALFTKMRLFDYTVATFIGVVPFAFIFSYGSELATDIQMIIGISLVFAMLVGYKQLRRTVISLAKK